MELYKGINALSEFRRTKLLKQLQQIDSGISDVVAEFVHFVDTNRAAGIGEGDRLQKLLTYDTPFDGARTGELFLVAPRPGTISPWSSKATDIALSCGLKDVNRIERGKAFYVTSSRPLKREKVQPLLFDRMTETVLDSLDEAAGLFESRQPNALVTVDVLIGGQKSLKQANSQFGLALSDDEIDYLYHEYKALKRNPTDAELMMFGVVNREHCRHKIFNANWTINGKKMPKSLLEMIKNTYEKGGQNVLSAYSDNAAVIKGSVAGRFFADPSTKTYGYNEEPIHSVLKVETHNHPTAIAPFPGAATGSGGEIRDE